MFHSYKRSERVGDLIRREIADIIMHKTKDPRIGFITVTGVDLSNDLRHAKVYISVYERETEGTEENTLQALKNATGFIRGELSKRVRLRFMPEIVFKLDKSAEYGEKIERLLREQNE